MQFLEASWPAPNNVRAYTTTRQDGYSRRPFDSFNLAEHVGDDLEQVTKNRQLLSEVLDLPSNPIWLEQVHGNKVIVINDALPAGKMIADAAITQMPNRICTVMTADCLPILLCDRKGTHVSAIHAGWRGLASDVINNTVAYMKLPGSELMAWLGPAIGPEAFEVSADVLEAFTAQDPKSREGFKPKPGIRGKWLADIYFLAKMKLNTLGITEVYGGNYCTFTNEEIFYSYRRDSGKTGRMATLIWLSA